MSNSRSLYSVLIQKASNLRWRAEHGDVTPPSDEKLFFKFSDIKDELLHLRSYIDSKPNKGINGFDDRFDDLPCDVLYSDGKYKDLNDFKYLNDNVELLSIVVYFNL